MHIQSHITIVKYEDRAFPQEIIFVMLQLVNREKKKKKKKEKEILQVPMPQHWCESLLYNNVHIIYVTFSVNIWHAFF